MYSLTHFFPVVGREMTARGSTQIFSLCCARLPSVHTHLLPPLCFCISLSQEPFPPLPVQLYFPEHDLILPLVCVCVRACRKFDTRCPSQGAYIRHTYADSESCCVIVSSVCGGNTGIRLSASPCMTSLRQIPSTMPSLPTHTHKHTQTPYCSHAFLAPDAWYKILLDSSGRLYWKGHFLFLFPTC